MMTPAAIADTASRFQAANAWLTHAQAVKLAMQTFGGILEEPEGRVKLRLEGRTLWWRSSGFTVEEDRPAVAAAA